MLKTGFAFVKWLIICIFAFDKRMMEGADSSLFFILKTTRMIDKNIVTQLAESYLDATDNYLVDVQIKPGNLIVIEIDNDEAVSIDDCIGLSKYVEEHLDREVEDYELEVGSAGVTSPFKVLRQYQKNIGNEVEVLLNKGIKLSGVLKDTTAEGIVLSVTKQIKPEGAKRKQTIVEDQNYSFDEIKNTKYLIRFK